MTKVKLPLLSFTARRKLGDDIVFARRRGVNIAEAKPEPPDVKSLAQLSWRHMFQKVVALWHALSAAEKEAWESLARRRHMTGYAWFLSQALRPNPGIYLPLQGGIMSGDIDMATNKIEDLPDPALAQDADTKAARDAAIAAALAGSLHCDIYGYDGANWQTLLVESSTLKNLRTRLYSGANAIGTATMDTIQIGIDHGLFVNAIMRGRRRLGVESLPTNADGVPVQNVEVDLATVSFLYGFNGATFDRLRSYGTGILKVGRAAIGLLDVRRVGTGQVGATGARKLYWITMNPSAGNSVMELTDDTDGSTAIRLDHFHTSRQAHHSVYDPPMEFTNGIYLKTFTNMTSIIFGYK